MKEILIFGSLKTYRNMLQIKNNDAVLLEKIWSAHSFDATGK